jgi:hypothetical protein
MCLTIGGCACMTTGGYAWPLEDGLITGRCAIVHILKKAEKSLDTVPLN